MSDDQPSRAKIVRLLLGLARLLIWQLGVVVFYIVAAIMMVTVNKWVLISVQIPVFFLACQLAIAVLLLLSCHYLGIFVLPHWNWATVKSLAPLIVTNVLGLAFNNLCLQYVDASFYQVARGLVLPITVAIALVTKQGAPTAAASACCALITFGFLFGVLFDQHSSSGVTSSSSLGIVFGILSSLTTGIQAIVIKASLPLVGNSAIHLAWCTNLLSMIAIVPLIPIAGELSGLQGLVRDPGQLHTFVIGTLVTGVFGFLICLAGLLSIKVTSPVTHMVSGAARGVIQTCLSVWLFHDILSSARLLSVLVITVGGMAYVWIKHLEQQASQATVTSAEDVENQLSEGLLAKDERP